MNPKNKEIAKNLARVALVNAIHKGPALLYKHRKRLLKTGSKTMRLSPLLLIGSRLVIKYLEKKKII